MTEKDHDLGRLARELGLFMGIDDFAITTDGSVIAIDSYGNYAYVPEWIMDHYTEFQREGLPRNRGYGEDMVVDADTPKAGTMTNKETSCCV
ncbi:MAG: hypothetical protein KGI00_04920 [Candidatus Micrarchaeota archaeon]|nr:hypothetical protein [Candidatus Micrarchaeota archaeon]